MPGRLETAVNLAILTTCVASLSLLGVRAFGPSPSSGRVSVEGLHAGEEFPTIKGIDVATSEFTLALVLSAECRYCEESLPFYKRLSRELRERRVSAVKTVLLTRDPASMSSDYVQRNSLSLDAIVNVSDSDLRRLRIAGTPTLVLVNQSGRITRTWFGRLDRAGERDVEATLGVGQ